MRISAEDAADLAEGAALLGAGGGGDTTHGAALMRHALDRHGPVRLVRADELAPDAWVIPVAAIGAVSVMVERLPGDTEFVAAVRAMERHLGVRAAALHGLEAAGINALLPVAAAAWLGLPLVDADGMGRAFPRLDQTVFDLAGLPPAPLALAEPSGTQMIITAPEGASLERLARAVLPALGGWAATAQWPMRASTSRRHALHGTVSRALRLGRALRHARRHADERDRALAQMNGRRLGTGVVIEVRQRDGAAHTGTVTIENTAGRRTLRLDMADEYLLAIDDGVVTAHVPEIIALLHARTWRPIFTEEVAVGQHVDVLAVPAPAALGDPATRRLMGPEAFGLDLPDDLVTAGGGGGARPCA
ncbi:DUF917 domain-containing protein [Actinomadura sp. NPDC047616]|uniref:DUF917 domain-containing protein n=1 Tax=Actinomadura sp. NPDC047616 TaxID=3155914 RepID=UPI0033CC7F3F